jgi:elongation factor P
LKEGNPVALLRYEDSVIGVELPITVELEVAETEPGVRGDTVSGVTKAARLETGASVQVPLFVNQGDRIRVDTRSGAYMERV